MLIVDLGPHHLTPPRSPELSGIYRREFKENKEPSPKVKRKRSVKISNVALEPVQWQNDSLQIITSASDLKSMDEFLLKKVRAFVKVSKNTVENRWQTKCYCPLLLRVRVTSYDRIVVLSPAVEMLIPYLRLQL